MLKFEVSHCDAGSHARAGRVSTCHGVFDTPAFMPVGTQASVKGLLPAQVAGVGSQILLGNTYHLMLRPGSELIADMGGLHDFMRWDKPILTDSGGFQVFSLAKINRISDQGVAFDSHIDGAKVMLTPSESMRVQNDLGSDIMMAFDDCPPADTQTIEGQARVKQACERSARWLGQCMDAHKRKDVQSLFGIVQGGTDLALRDWSLQATCQYDLPGYAIGGVAVGEGPEQLKRVVDYLGPRMPEGKPRYLMGVGYECDIYQAVRAGVDMFDCVLPTRNGRNANAFTPTGQMRLRNAVFARDGRPIDEGCDCPACGGGFSRGYLRHLFMAKEMLGPALVSLHNLRHFQRYLLDIRRAIADNGWSWLISRWPVALGRDGAADSPDDALD